MRKIILASLALLMCANLSFAKDYKDSEFTPLFNGKDFNDWYIKLRTENPELGKKIFAIEDGMIHVFGKGFPKEYEIDKNDTHGLVYTKKKYSKYILRFKYKWGTNIANNFSKFQYDAGCYYHVQRDRIWPVGIEYQVRYDHRSNKNHTGDYYLDNKPVFNWFSDGKGNFLMEKDGGVPTPRKKGPHYALKGAKVNGLNDQWNDCEIIVMADKYCIHKLNGVIVNMATEIGHVDGIIGFQCETAEIYYKDIIIKEFDEVIPMESFF